MTAVGINSAWALMPSCLETFTPNRLGHYCWIQSHSSSEFRGRILVDSWSQFVQGNILYAHCQYYFCLSVNVFFFPACLFSSLPPDWPAKFCFQHLRRFSLQLQTLLHSFLKPVQRLKNNMIWFITESLHYHYPLSTLFTVFIHLTEYLPSSNFKGEGFILTCSWREQGPLSLRRYGAGRWWGRSQWVYS